ncbi:MAG: GyrI-like domain-containing protein [Planctomycetes bacterium]|nr:GyrI-like domain-containing protein [Planctomycetota bacterium]
MSAKKPSRPKIDLFRELKPEYASPTTPKCVTTTPGTYLAIKGSGEPGGAEYQEKIGTIYAAAYTLKFDSKAAGQDYTVGKMETQYWVDSKKSDFAATPRSKWNWQILIRVPAHQTRQSLETTLDRLRGKGRCEGIDALELIALHEGDCVQMLHVGPFDLVGEAVARMESFMKREGLQRHGRHHEIYLSDPRRVEPERLKTIVRIPVK